MDNISKLKKEFIVEPIPANANLVNMPNSYFDFYRFLINNYFGCKLKIKLEVLEVTEERELYEKRR
jgi:hypothetical protein